MNRIYTEKHQKSLPIVKEKSCGIVLFRKCGGDYKFLLLHYPGGHWDFSKGHVENEDKDEKSTAMRELKEETGISKINFKSNFRETMFYAFNRGKKERVEKSVVYFIAESEEETVQLSHEHKGFQWLSYEDAIARLTFENAQEILSKAYQFITEK